MTLLEVTDQLNISDDKTNIAIEFNVPIGISDIEIDFDYSPKIVEESAALDMIDYALKKYNVSGNPCDYLPVKNLITLSIDDNGTYRGAAHRQDNIQHHVISRDFASPGFVKGRINWGIWRIVLNVHCIGCNVNYNIKVQGRKY